MKRKEDKERAMIAEIAKMYYVDGIPQADIADQFFFSKSKVSRALQIAREEHIIEFQINYPLIRSMRLEKLLKAKYELSDALVVTDLYSNQSSDVSIRRISELCAEYLDEVLQDGDRIGLSWGRTLEQVIAHIKPSSPRRIHVVQLIGNSSDDYHPGKNISSLVHTMAQAYQGTESILYAPMFVASDIVRGELMKEHIIQNAMSEIEQVNWILTGIADVSQGMPNSWAGYMTDEIRNELTAKGAVGYICGYFFDRNGRLLQNPINRSLIGVSFQQIKDVPRVIAVAGGLDKSKAIHAALRGGLINILVTDSRIAEKLLAL